MRTLGHVLPFLVGLVSSLSLWLESPNLSRFVVFHENHAYVNDIDWLLNMLMQKMF